MTRPLAAAVLVAASAATAAAQSNYAPSAPCLPPGLATGAVAGGYPVSSSGQPVAPMVASGYAALPPDPAALDRLRLTTEWTTYLPLQGRRDGVGLVQPVDETQVFVQTRSGLLAAVDARTGGVQWTYRYATGYAALFPVAVTDRLVFAVNVARLIAIQRYTGAIEFDLPLAGSATAGPAAAVVPVYALQNGVPVKVRELLEVYVVLNANRVVAYPVPAGTLAGPVPVAVVPPQPVEVMPPVPPSVAEYAPAAGLTSSRTPSITALPTITPPYTLYGRHLHRTPSLEVLPSLRVPYTLKPDYLKTTQRSPSISVLPPSAVRAFELANLVRREQQLSTSWVYGSTARLGSGAPVVSPSLTPSEPLRVWVGTDGPTLTGLSAAHGQPMVPVRLEDAAAGPMAGPAVVGDVAYGFVPLVSGVVVAIDLARGGLDGPVTEWRTGVGGVPNRKPVPTTDAVYFSGDNAGVTKVDVRTGDVLWRTASGADRLLAVAGDHVYVRDRAGNLLIYPRATAAAGADRRVEPIGRLSVAHFNVPVTNERTDRVLLAADNGLLVSLRDADPRFVLPARISPPVVLPVRLDAPPPAPADATTPPPAPEPKKEKL